MVDATKQPPVITDIKSFFSFFKTRRTVAFAYGFIFAFVAFTVFLAFNPSPNSSSLWFTNIFSTTATTKTPTSTDSYRSQFSSIYSYFFPDNNNSQSSPTQAFNFSSSSPPQVSTTRSTNNTFSKPPKLVQPDTRKGTLAVNTTQTINKANEAVNNHTQASLNFGKAQTFNTNRTAKAAAPLKATASGNQTTNSSSLVVKNAPPSGNQTTNSSSLVEKKAPPSGNQTKNSSSLVQKNGEKGEKGSDYSASLLKEHNQGAKQGNASKTDTGMLAKQGIEGLMESLMKCDLFDGEWIRDDSYPLYQPGACSFLDEQFNCVRNGRPDRDYQKLKWKPKACTLPRLNGAHMLELLRGKRLVFVGDSLNRNMWESLVCILKNSAKDPSKVFEAHGHHHFRGEASYSFVFQDYNSSVEFFVSPFLVQEWEMPEKNGAKKETLRLDLVGRSSDQYKNADIIIFNTGHWWTHDKTSKGKDYYQEGSHVYGELNVLEAFRKALTTWSRWVDASVNPSRTMVFFRGYSASHFSGGQWNSGGACDSETQPIKNETYLTQYPPKMLVLEKVLKNMKTHITYLNITRLTDFRKDGHPSIYRKQHIPAAERKSPLRYQDCSHWCLPGVPDSWNELFYAELIIKQNKMVQHQNQKRHR